MVKHTRVLHLFLILSVMIVSVSEERKALSASGLTTTQENHNSMQSMLLFENSSEEKGLRPQRAAPQEGKEKGQEQEKEKET